MMRSTRSSRKRGTSVVRDPSSDRLCDRYDALCTFAGHEEGGMIGNLVVKSLSKIAVGQVYRSRKRMSGSIRPGVTVDSASPARCAPMAR
jgi:hypothetical protein